MKKVILSFPYSGAIQAFFAHHLVGMDTHREPDSYYGTLWGKPDSQLQAFSLTLFTLYDEVIFAPVDNALPDSDRYWGEQEYYHPDLGLRMPARADAIGLDYHALNDYIDWVLGDLRVNALLSKVPALSRRQIMLQVICDVELSIRHGAQVMSNAGRRSLMRRLCEIDPQYNNAKDRIVNVLTPQAHVLDVLLPDFEISSVDLLHRIKTDPDTRKYGRSMANWLDTTSPRISERELYTLALQSNLKNARNQQVDRFCQITSKVFSVIGFSPVVGPLFSAAALALGESERVTRLSNSNWIEFKPHLARVNTRFEMEQRLAKAAT